MPLQGSQGTRGRPGCPELQDCRALQDQMLYIVALGTLDHKE